MTFARFLEPLPGAPWLLAAVLQIAALALGWRATRGAAAA